jgi:hypothetical protein
MEHADKLKTISYWGIFLSCFSDFRGKCIHAAPEHVLVYVYSGEQIIEDRNNSAERDQFLQLCETMDTSAARELRKFIRSFIKKTSANGYSN